MLIVCPSRNIIMIFSLINSARYYYISMFGVDLSYRSMVGFVTKSYLWPEATNTTSTDSFNSKYDNKTANLYTLLELHIKLWDLRKFVLFIFCCIDNMNCGHSVTLVFLVFFDTLKCDNFAIYCPIFVSFCRYMFPKYNWFDHDPQSGYYETSVLPTTHINMYNKNCMHPIVNCMYCKFPRINYSWFLKHVRVARAGIPAELKHLRIIHWNMAGVKSKIHALKSDDMQFQSMLQWYDIITLTETHSDENTKWNMSVTYNLRPLQTFQVCPENLTGL